MEVPPSATARFSTSLHQVVELRMCALSHRIREQPGWWEKVKDKAAVRKWREEALQEEEENDVAPSWKLTPTMVRSCYLWAAPPVLTLTSRSIMCSRNSTDTRLCVIRRLG